MIPYFYPRELSLYGRQFPKDRAVEFFPYDKEKEPAFVALLKMAMERGTPLTKTELIEAYGEKRYDACMFPEKRGYLSFDEEEVVRLFSDTKKSDLKDQQILFEQYSNIILDVLEERKTTRDLGLYFDDLLREYIKKSPFFEWKESDNILYGYIHNATKGKEFNESNAFVDILWVGTHINTEVLMHYLRKGKSLSAQR